MKGFWEKLEKIALFLLIAVIPTQLGRHFWPKWSLVVGVRVDYLAVTLYVVDILWLVLLFAWNKNIKYKKKKKVGVGFGELLMGIFVIVNVLVSVNKGVAIYSWIRIFQWAWFFKYCVNNKEAVKRILWLVIPWWVVGESCLGLAQLSKGSSLNGMWWWLGERRFSLTTIGVAQISVLGRGMLRAYGTFSHPNSLAGFLMVSLGIWTMFYKKTKRINWWIVVWAGILGIIISGSRTIWLLSLVLMVMGFVRVFRGKVGTKQIIGYLVIIFGLFLLVLGIVNVNYRSGDFLSGWDNDSLVKRVSLSVVALKMWRENLMLGVGAGNFIPRLPEYQVGNQFYWLQPVHNIFLLAGSQVGMLGLLILSWWLWGWWGGKSFKKNWWLWVVIFLSGMVDHYWITLPQNTWLLAVVMAVI